MKKKQRIFPGFSLSMGFVTFYLSLIVILPLFALIFKVGGLSLEEIKETLCDERALSAFFLSFRLAGVAVVLNAFLGLIIAWTLVRYSFPGRHLVDAIVDLPFALPTAVAGIALTALYVPHGWLGQFFSFFGVEVAYTSLGVTLALIFVSLPFIVRSLQPVIEDLPEELEEVSACLGASRWQTFWRVIFPAIFPALLSGMVMGFGRALGEFGSVVFISGNLPFKTEIFPLLIMAKIEEYDYEGASVLALAMLFVAFAVMMIVNLVQHWQAKRTVRI